MIITKEVEIYYASNMIYYQNLGYTTINKKIIVKVSDLPKQSHTLVIVKCDVCGKEKEVRYCRYIYNTNYLKEEYCCSKKCAHDKCERRLMESYGVINVFQLDKIKNKSKETMMINYGVEHPMYSDEIKNKLIETNNERYGTDYGLSNKNVRDKIESTNIERYGYKTPFLNDDVINKINNTMIKNYGVNHPMHSEEIKTKLKNTNIKKYGVDNVSKSDIIKDKLSKILTIKKQELAIDNYKNKHNLNVIYNDNTTYTIKCELCNNNYVIIGSLLSNRLKYKTNTCTLCNPIGKFYSDKENDLFKFIKENYNGEIISNSRKIIQPYEIDIYLPELKLAFEFNGVYWHSDSNKPNDYHNIKSNLSEDKDIFLVHIYEDIWCYNNEKIKTYILSLISKKIETNNFSISEINKIELVNDFLNLTYIEDKKLGEINIGLFYENELNSLLSFNNIGNNNYELVLISSKGNIKNYDSNMIKYFIKNYNPEIITTIIDRTYNNIFLYKILGFEIDSYIKPDYKYVLKDKRILKENIEYLDKNKIYDSGYYKLFLKNRI